MIKKSIVLGALLIFLTKSLSMTIAAEEIHPDRHISSSDPTGIFLETEDCVYCYDFGSDLMFYLDDSDMSWNVLCNEPECSHEIIKNEFNELTSECNGYLNYNVNCGIILWKERIFYTVYDYSDCGISLYSCKPDGTDHRVEKRFPNIDQASQYGYLDRGLFYLEYNFYGEKENQTYVYQLDALNEEPICIWNSYESYGGLNFFEKAIYYCIFHEDTWTIDIYRMNYDGTGKELLKAGQEIGTTIWTEEGYYVLFDGERIVFYTYSGEEKDVWNAREQGYECKFSYYVDDDFFYLYGLGEDGEHQGENELFLILDKNGNCLEEMTIPNEKKGHEELEALFWEDGELSDLESNLLYVTIFDSIGDPIAGYTSEYIFANNGVWPDYYLKKSEIGSGKCHWEKIERNWKP